jgi:hypothetical protein
MQKVLLKLEWPHTITSQLRARASLASDISFMDADACRINPYDIDCELALSAPLNRFASCAGFTLTSESIYQCTAEQVSELSERKVSEMIYKAVFETTLGETSLSAFAMNTESSNITNVTYRCYQCVIDMLVDLSSFSGDVSDCDGNSNCLFAPYISKFHRCSGGLLFYYFGAETTSTTTASTTTEATSSTTTTEETRATTTSETTTSSSTTSPTTTSTSSSALESTTTTTLPSTPTDSSTTSEEDETTQTSNTDEGTTTSTEDLTGSAGGISVITLAVAVVSALVLFV